MTLLEFPIWFSHVVASDALGLLLPLVRNGLLVAASLLACRELWRQTVTEPALREAAAAVPAQAAAQSGRARCWSPDASGPARPR